MRTKEKWSVVSDQWSVRAFASPVLRVTFSLLLSACCLSSARAQDDPPPLPVSAQRQDDIEVLKIDSDLVNLNVSVFNLNSRQPAGDLRQSDFAVLENGGPEEITFFASASSPFDLLLLLDLSGSISNKLDLVRKSARRFVESARPADRIGIITFTDVPVLVSPLTSDRELLIERIKNIEKPRGGTNFWDAVDFALRLQLRSHNDSRRQAVIIMSDGVDNALPDINGPGSATSYETLLESVRSSESIVIPIYLDTEQEEIRKHRANGLAYRIARQQLAELANESGSLLYNARKLEDLKGVYEQVIRDLGTVYSIGYRPTNKKRDGSWRSVAVRLPNRTDLAARTRRGYFAK